MKNELDNETLVKRFLLGGLSEAERAEVEDRFFVDDDFFQEVLLREDDLIDAYVRGELPAAESALFERCCLATERGRERVEFAKAFLGPIPSETRFDGAPREQHITTPGWSALFARLTGGRRALGLTLAATLLLAILGGLWFLIDRARTRSAPTTEVAARTTEVPKPHESTPLRQTGQQPRQQEADPAKPTPPKESQKRTTPVVATFTLLPGAVRGEEGAPTLVLAAGTTEARLRLVVDGQTYPRYRATLSTAEGIKLWERVVRGSTTNRSAGLTLSLPAELLKSGDYVLELVGATADGNWESVADYSFRITRN